MVTQQDLDEMTPQEATAALDRIIRKVAARRGLNYEQAAVLVGNETPAFTRVRQIQQRAARQTNYRAWQDPRLLQFQKRIKEKYPTHPAMAGDISFLLDYIDLVDEMGGDVRYDLAALLYSMGKHRTLLSWVTTVYPPEELREINRRFTERYRKEEANK